ncbi:recombinase family protein [Kitasatospora sp. NPDC004723]|uniref:recombinase family protein n=1 Tax=Kitasatospora sp. NPDC004723 TaxID=3154288 RepID=UPI0033BC7BEA
MDKDLITRVQQGRFEGMNWAGLTRLSTEEEEGDLPDEDEPGRIPYLTGRDIKSTDEQEKDDREFVERRGGAYVWTYREPDTSAWKRRRVRLPDGTLVHRVIRPVLDGALNDLKARRAPNGKRIDGLIVYDIDRLTRDPRHLEDCIDVVQRYGVPIIDITGSLDLLTDNGRAMARVITAMNNKASADTARRVSRKHRAMQQAGIPAGGPRPFGWMADRRTLDPEETKLLRDAAQKIITARQWNPIVAEWRRKGILTASGSQWTTMSLKLVLSNPRICGYRSRTEIEYDEETQAERRRMVPVYDEKGQPVQGVHDAILTVKQWEDICEILESGPGRGTAVNSRTYLGSGTLRCGKSECNGRMRGVKSYDKKKPPGFFNYTCGDCHGVSAPGPDVDELIRKIVIAKHRQESARRRAKASSEQWPHEKKLATVLDNMAEAKKAHRGGKISAASYYRDLAEYEAEERKLRKQRAKWIAQHSGAKPVDIEEQWNRPNVTLEERRAFVENALAALVVLPVGKGARVPLRDRLVPVYNAED